MVTAFLPPPSVTFLYFHAGGYSFGTPNPGSTAKAKVMKRQAWARLPLKPTRIPRKATFA